MPVHRYSIICCLFSLFLFGCKNAPEKGEAYQLGEAHLNVHGAPEALPHFEKGLLLLHSFEYADARTAFEKAIAADSDFVMAHWGKAMTFNHAVWQRQGLEEGQAALEAIGPSKEDRLAKAKSELERDLLQCAEILFFGEGNKIERDQAYSKQLELLHQKYPENHEISAFYALSLLGSVPYGRDEAVYEKGAGIAQKVLAENPNHPGALHYLIHSYDDPKHAHLAKFAADSYAKVAPDAAHALHMPSHIYVALGMWPEVVSSNEASWAASVNRMHRMELDNDAQSYHALQWLQYGYLQQGRFEDAGQLLRDMEKYTEELPSKSARSYIVRMKAAYLTDTENWLHPLQSISTDVTDLNITQRAVYAFTDGMQAFAQKDSATLRQIILKMDEDRQKAGLNVSDKGVPMCSAGGWSSNENNQLEIDQAAVMALELRALYAQLQGDAQKANLYLNEATSLEASLAYEYGPPAIPKPSYELYGEWLLTNNQPAEALQQFEKAIQRGPNRIQALRGKWLAAQALGDEALINTLTEKLNGLLEKADKGAFYVPSPPEKRS